MADNDYDAGLRGDTVGHDTSSPEYQAGVQARERRANSGGGAGDGGALAGAGGGGIVFAAFLVILAFLGFIVAISVYPIAGLLTIISFGIGFLLINGDGTMNGVGVVFALSVPCYVVYRCGHVIEVKLGRFRPYQIFRTYWRLAASLWVGHVVGTLFHFKDGQSYFSVSGYTMHAIVLFLGFVFAYRNSLVLDEKWGLKAYRVKWIDKLIMMTVTRLPIVGKRIRKREEERLAALKAEVAAWDAQFEALSRKEV